MMTLQQVLDGLPDAQAVFDARQAGLVLSRVHTDTRTLRQGDLFVALQGERFDAHDFLARAREAGAVAALAQRGLAQAGLPGVLVPDTTRALGQLATAWRARHGLPLIAVTGSNGKTTVTQMIASILRADAGDAALATQGNLNNAIGVPLTLLRLRDTQRWAVVELGMNHPGEIAVLAAMARPTVALVNNAQREHLEYMATVQAVAEENGSVIDALGQDGVAVFPADDAYAELWRRRAGERRCWTFALDLPDGQHAQVSARQPRWHDGHWAVRADTPLGPLSWTLNIAGRHNVKNALAAAACALAAGVPPEAVVRGLEAFEPVQGRSRAQCWPRPQGGLTLVDDSYNANPDSVRAAIDVLAELPGPRLLVLGDMGEVGDQGPAFHAEAGQYARQKNIENLCCVGVQSMFAATQFGAGRHFDSVESLTAAVLQALPHTVSVLVKGSRFMKMERVVQAIGACAAANNKETPCS